MLPFLVLPVMVMHFIVSLMRAMLRHSLLPLLATWLWLLHALLPFFALYQLPSHKAAPSAAFSSLFGDTVLVCTAEGFRLVSWKDIQSGKTTITPHKQYQCPLCYVAAHGQGIQAAPPAAHTPALNAYPTAVAYLVSHDTPSRARLWQQRLTRSPPASFIS